MGRTGRLLQAVGRRSGVRARAPNPGGSWRGRDVGGGAEIVGADQARHRHGAVEGDRRQRPFRDPILGFGAAGFKWAGFNKTRCKGGQGVPTVCRRVQFPLSPRRVGLQACRGKDDTVRHPLRMVRDSGAIPGPTVLRLSE